MVTGSMVNGFVSRWTSEVAVKRWSPRQGCMAAVSGSSWPVARTRDSCVAAPPAASVQLQLVLLLPGPPPDPGTAAAPGQKQLRVGAAATPEPGSPGRGALPARDPSPGPLLCAPRSPGDPASRALHPYASRAAPPSARPAGGAQSVRARAAKFQLRPRPPNKRGGGAAPSSPGRGGAGSGYFPSFSPAGSLRERPPHFPFQGAGCVHPESRLAGGRPRSCWEQNRRAHTRTKAGAACSVYFKCS